MRKLVNIKQKKSVGCKDSIMVNPTEKNCSESILDKMSADIKKLEQEIRDIDDRRDNELPDELLAENQFLKLILDIQKQLKGYTASLESESPKQEMQVDQASTVLICTRMESKNDEIGIGMADTLTLSDYGQSDAREFDSKQHSQQCNLKDVIAQSDGEVVPNTLQPEEAPSHPIPTYTKGNSKQSEPFQVCSSNRKRKNDSKDCTRNEKIANSSVRAALKFREQSKTSYVCEVCNKQFTRKFNLLTHLRIHTGEKPYECNVCNRSFSHKNSLNLHLRIHTGEKPYECTVCNRSFNQESNLNVHSRIHTGEKPYECFVCNKSFNLKSTLNLHLRIHTGEKPYECTVCNRSFNQESNLNVHSRIHTGEKPYECTVCNRSFSHKNSLNLHSRIHTDEEPYQCDICSMSFIQKIHLSAHMRIHSGKMPHKCKICKKPFRYRKSLSNHLKSHDEE